MSEKWTTNFCSLKKWRLQAFLMKKAESTNFLMKKADTTNFCNEHIYVNKNLKNAHLRCLLASAALLWIEPLKLKGEYGPCYISVHTSTIFPSNICIEGDGWVRLALDDLLTLTLTLQCQSNLCSLSLTFVFFYGLLVNFVVSVRLLQSMSDFC